MSFRIRKNLGKHRTTNNLLVLTENIVLELPSAAQDLRPTRYKKYWNTNLPAKSEEHTVRRILAS